MWDEPSWANPRGGETSQTLKVLILSNLYLVFIFALCGKTDGFWLLHLLTMLSSGLTPGTTPPPSLTISPEGLQPPLQVIKVTIVIFVISTEHNNNDQQPQ